MTMSNGRGKLRQYLICVGLFRICLLANFRYTGSSRKSVKSKFVCTGINFHKKWILWGVLGSEIATNLSSTSTRSVFRFTGWHRPTGGRGLMPPSLRNKKLGLSWSMGLWKNISVLKRHFQQHFVITTRKVPSYMVDWAEEGGGEFCWEFGPGGGGKVCQAPQAACQGLQARWWRHLWGKPEKDLEGPGCSGGVICRYFSWRNSCENWFFVKINTPATWFTFNTLSGWPCKNRMSAKSRSFLWIVLLGVYQVLPFSDSVLWQVGQSSIAIWLASGTPASCKLFNSSSRSALIMAFFKGEGISIILAAMTGWSSITWRKKILSYPH